MIGRMIEAPLVSNGYPLMQSPERLGWLEPTDPGLRVERLREQYHAQGYLWLKGILKRDSVLAFRRRFFSAFLDTGLLAAGTDPVDGIYSGQSKGEGGRLADIVKWASYESFCLMPEIWQFYERFMGGPVYLHKRKLIRHNVPGQVSCTGAHYDLVYLRGGTDTVCSSWIPIGDVPVEMGGLIYLEGSDALGRKMEADFSVRNASLPPEERISAYNKNMNTGWLTKDVAALAEKANARWLMADYEAGDMVVHSAYMVHAATQNVDPLNRIRLSTDIRYQLVSEKIDPRWANHWSPDDML
jgi:ectoine hydroxylase-related dioxygenase (phytanoyl-CoA dioxygenase family)